MNTSYGLEEVFAERRILEIDMVVQQRRNLAAREEVPEGQMIQL